MGARDTAWRACGTLARAGASRPQAQISVREGRRLTIPAVEAALVILVPEAEDLVRPFREAYDPSAAKGMPAHITINYPFLPGASPSSDLEDRLRALFSRFASFSFRLEGPASFPDVLYLAPHPSGILRADWTLPADERFLPLVQLIGWKPERDVPFDLPIQYQRGVRGRSVALIPSGTWVLPYDDAQYQLYERVLTMIHTMLEQVGRAPTAPQTIRMLTRWTM